MQPVSLALTPSPMSPRHDTKSMRPVAKFPASFLGDCFLKHTPVEEAIKCQKEEEVEKLKQLVRNELMAAVTNPKRKLIYIDAIQRLGVAYHFEKDIRNLLNNFYNNLYDDGDFRDDLQYVSLRFRLLREHGFYTSCDAFYQFKDECGIFKDVITCNVQGLLILYEASYLRVRGEDILDEALVFTTHHLTYIAMHSSSLLATKVNHSLKRPLHRCTPRLEAKFQISFYESEPSHDKILLKFSKLDFDLLQITHKKELRDLTRWWKELDLASKLPFARNRLIECYFWIVSMNPEPIYSLARLPLTKMLKMVSLVDDIYDAYGTFEELEIFTGAIQRWDRNNMNQLPNYMMLVLETVIDIMKHLEQELHKQGRSYAIHYLQQEWKDLCTAYMQEAKWRHEKYVPTFDEYIRNGIVTSTYPLLIALNYQCMDIASIKAFEWLHHQPKSIVGTSIIGRVLNDLASYKFEQSREHVATSVECYIKQYGVSEEEACRKLQEMVDDCWKNITNDMFHPTIVALPLLIQILNLTRITNENYTIDQDGYTNSKIIHAKAKALLIDNYDIVV